MGSAQRPPKREPRNDPTAWGKDIDPNRQSTLKNYFPHQFAGERLTGADVYWLAVCTLVAGETTRQPENTLLDPISRAKAQLEKAKKDPLLRASLNFSLLDLSGAQLSGANLEDAVLGRVCLTGATMGAINLRDAYLGGAKLNDAFLDRATLEGTILRGAQMARTSLRFADARWADLGDATLNDAIMRNADLREAKLIGAHLARVDLREASLQQANFIQADLTDAFLFESMLQRTLFTDADMTGCDLRRTQLNAESRLNGAKLDRASLEQILFKETNLAVVEWKPFTVTRANGEPEHFGVILLGDEVEAKEQRKRVYTYDAEGRQRDLKHGKRKTAKQRAKDFRAAERAYRALAVTLSDQGLSRDGTRFQYTAEVMGRKAQFFERHYFRWGISLALGFFAGYGIHQIWRLLLTYVGAILGFTIAYYAIGRYGIPTTTMTPINALLLSFMSFHGRGLAPTTGLTDVMRYVAVGEALIGVLVEALLVAALVRRITGD